MKKFQVINSLLVGSFFLVGARILGPPYLQKKRVQINENLHHYQNKYYLAAVVILFFCSYNDLYDVLFGISIALIFVACIYWLIFDVLPNKLSFDKRTNPFNIFWPIGLMLLVRAIFVSFGFRGELFFQDRNFENSTV